MTGDSRLSVSAGPDVHGEIIEKRSRFLALLRPVETEAQARDFVAELRKRYPDARHHCSAFVLAVDGAQPIERSSDDGEPAGTAGTPMLDVVRGSALTGVACVVVRWFGGTKLGTGGLARAYSAATSRVLDSARAQRRIVRLTEVPAWRTVVDHDVAGKLEGELRAAGADVLEVDHGARVTLRVAADHSVISPILAALTSGDGKWVESGAATRSEIVEN